MNTDDTTPEQPAAGFTPAAGKLARQVMAKAAHHTPDPEQAQAGTESMAERLWDVYRAHYDNPTPWEELAPADRLPWIAVVKYTLRAMVRLTRKPDSQAQPQQPGRPNRHARRAAAKQKRQRGAR